MSEEYDKLAKEKKRRQLAWEKHVLSGAEPLYFFPKSSSKSPRRSKNILIMPSWIIDKK